MKTADKKKQLARKAERLWKKVALLKWGDRCLVCGKPASTFHHFIPRSRSLVLKYDVENAIPICTKCHYKIHFSSNPVEVAEIVDLIKKKRGEEWVDYIDEKRKILSHGLNNIKWYEEQIKKLKRQLSKYSKNYD